MKISNTQKKVLEYVLFLLIIVLAGIFRFTGINWDNNAHLHPDERYMTMVAVAIDWPKDFKEYLDPQSSPLSPANNQFGNYIYGTFPLFFVKYVAERFEMGDYNNLTLVGRTISGIIDIGNLILIYLIGNRIFKKKLGLLAALFYAVAVMPIQQSHFFTTDTYETFFILFTFLLLIYFIKTKSVLTSSFLGLFIGISMGLALSSKISSVVFGLVIGVALGMKFLKQYELMPLKKNVFHLIDYSLIIGLVIYVVFRLTSPYIFENSSWFDLNLNTQFMSSLQFQRSAISGEVMFPPQYNWVDTTPYIFPLTNIFVWGLGIPLSIALIIGILSYVYDQIIFLKRHNRFRQLFIPLTSPLLLLVLWVIGDFLYRGGNFVKSFRYLLAIIPFLVILASLGITQLQRINKKLFFVSILVVFIPTLLWAIAFTSIYTRPTTRIAASDWVYENISPDSTIANEHWDDAIPFKTDGPPPFEFQQRIELEVYAPDDDRKIPYLYENLSEIDYIFITSDRARMNIGELPDLFPVMSNYYKALDNGSLGFEKVAEFTSFPNIFGYEINDSKAEETFWVYDHPTVRIYKKKSQLDFQRFECVLRGGITIMNRCSINPEFSQ